MLRSPAHGSAWVATLSTAAALLLLATACGRSHVDQDDVAETISPAPVEAGRRSSFLARLEAGRAGQVNVAHVALLPDGRTVVVGSARQTDELWLDGEVVSRAASGQTNPGQSFVLAFDESGAGELVWSAGAAGLRGPTSHRVIAARVGDDGATGLILDRQNALLFVNGEMYGLPPYEQPGVFVSLGADGEVRSAFVLPTPDACTDLERTSDGWLAACGPSVLRLSEDGEVSTLATLEEDGGDTATFQSVAVSLDEDAVSLAVVDHPALLNGVPLPYDRDDRRVTHVAVTHGDAATVPLGDWLIAWSGGRDGRVGGWRLDASGAERWVVDDDEARLARRLASPPDFVFARALEGEGRDALLTLVSASSNRGALVRAPSDAALESFAVSGTIMAADWRGSRASLVLRVERDGTWFGSPLEADDASVYVGGIEPAGP